LASRRRIEDDGAEALVRRLEAAQQIEGVAFPDLRSSGQPVELEIAPREGERVGGGVEEQGLGCAIRQGEAGEGAGVAEGVQDPAALGVTGEERAVLGLVQVEPCLLSGARGDREAAAALGYEQLLARRVVLRLEAFEPRGRLVIGPMETAPGEESGKPLGDGRRRP